MKLLLVGMNRIVEKAEDIVIGDAKTSISHAFLSAIVTFFMFKKVKKIR